MALDLQPELGIAQVDPAKFADILTNLLINAIKFTPDGGTLRIAAGPHGPDQVRFEVADPGVGIEEADRPHLFEPFFTGFDTMHHSSGDYQFCKRGMGLGLCLVKTFVELHGGTIEVATSPGEGSTFAFIIPRSPGRLHHPRPGLILGSRSDWHSPRIRRRPWHRRLGTWGSREGPPPRDPRCNA